MKIEINSQKLRQAVSLTERIAQKQATLPVLSCILIEVNKNEAIFRATNLDCGVEVTLPVKSEGTGTFAVPAKTLASFVSQIPGGEQVVKFEEVSGNLSVSSLRSKGLLKTVPPEDFPAIPVIAEGETIEMPVEALTKGLGSVSYSAAVSGVKPELSSVYVYQEGENLIFAATDSFRLAEKKIKVPINLKVSETLIPLKNIPDIVRTLEHIGGIVKIQSNKNLISFRAANTYFVSRIIDGTFPDYRQIIPKSHLSEAVVLKQDILNAIKISSVFSDKFNQVHFVVDPQAKIFEIQTKNSDIGENKTTIDGALTGERLEINFNSRYLADCFQSIDADSVSLQLSGANRPLVIRPVSGDQSFMYLVMPMNR